MIELTSQVGTPNRSMNKITANMHTSFMNVFSYFGNGRNFNAEGMLVLVFIIVNIMRHKLL